MGTTGKNNFVRSSLGQAKSLFPDAINLLDPTVSFNQGDLLALDTSGHLLKTVANATDCQNLLGVAPVTVVSGTLKSSYQGTAVDAAESAVSVGGPLYGAEVLMKLHTGDSFNPGDLVYPSIGDDAQTVSSSNPCNVHACGVFQDAAAASVAAGAKGRCVIGKRYPADTLTF